MIQPNFCVLPSGGWVNLSYVRTVKFFCKIHFVKPPDFCCQITWSNGDKEKFVGADARAIAQVFRNSNTSFAAINARRRMNIKDLS